MGSPEVSIVNINNQDEVYGATLVSVSSDIELQAVINIPFDATVGEYHIVVDDLSLPAAFQVTVVSSLVTQADAEFQLYPNPLTTNQLIINTLQNSKISIYDLNGRQVRDLLLLAGNHQINLSDLESGMYIVVNETETRKLTQKLIVQ